MSKFDQTFVREAKKLRSAAGDVWALTEPAQRPLVKQLQATASDFQAGVCMAEASRWAIDGRCRPVFPGGFKIDPFGVTMRGAERWGFFAGGALDGNTFLGDPPLLINREGKPQHLLARDGTRVAVLPGSAFDADPADDLFTLRINGRVTYIPGALPLPQEPLGASHLLGMFGGSKVIGLRQDRLTSPLGDLGVLPAAEPFATLTGKKTVVSESRYVVTDENGYLTTDENGNPIFSEDNSGESYEPMSQSTGEPVNKPSGTAFEAADVSGLLDLYLVLAPYSMWVLDNPTLWKPAVLDTAVGPLCEGTGFVNGDGCIHVFQDPKVLWPDGYCRFAVASYAAGHPRSFPLRARLEPGFGKNLSSYRRNTHSLVAFFKACCDVVGLEIAESEDVVDRVERHGLKSLIVMRSGKCVTCSGPVLRRSGDRVLPGETFSGALSLRSYDLQGPDWYRNRPWGLVGIPAKTFWPYAPSTLFIKDRSGWARSALDTENPLLPLRAKIELDGPEEDADTFWEEFESRERIAGGSWAADYFGFTVQEQEQMINPLEVAVANASPWAFAIEGALGSTAPDLWKRLQDFVEESKPAGSIAILGSTYFF